jgi:hypothetical protein
MINVMADIIGVDDAYSGDRLNDADTWDRFMAAVFKRMDDIDDLSIRAVLNGIDSEEFQEWIDDPGFWAAIDTEITRRLEVFKTILPSPNQGHC